MALPDSGAAAPSPLARTPMVAYSKHNLRSVVCVFLTMACLFVLLFVFVYFLFVVLSFVAVDFPERLNSKMTFYVTNRKLVNSLGHLMPKLYNISFFR